MIKLLYNRFLMYDLFCELFFFASFRGRGTMLCLLLVGVHKALYPTCSCMDEDSRRGENEHSTSCLWHEMSAGYAVP
jgi:hypothetical protein